MEHEKLKLKPDDSFMEEQITKDFFNLLNETTDSMPNEVIAVRSVGLTKLYAIKFNEWKMSLRPDEMVKINEVNSITPLTNDELFFKFINIKN